MGIDPKNIKLAAILENVKIYTVLSKSVRKRREGSTVTLCYCIHHSLRFTDIFHVMRDLRIPTLM